MTTPFSSEDLKKISRFVNEHIGFSYASERMSDLSRGYISACQELGEQSPVSCLKMLDDPEFSSKLEEMLVKKLTIGETYFYRDRTLFSQLRDQLLPDLIRTRRLGRKYLRIWSAACSTGEEAYSIAILLRYLIPDINDWEIFILATDINPGSLHAAQRGVFSKWSFREQSPVPDEKYLSPAPDGRFQVSEDIRRMVRFSKLNLITDHYPSTLTGTTTMDIILCRNVLMYFSSDMAASVVDRLNTSLIDTGWLIVSPQEINYAQRPGFIQIKRSSVFLFLKGDNDEEKERNVNIFSDYSQKSDNFHEIISDETTDEKPDHLVMPNIEQVHSEQTPALSPIYPSDLVIPRSYPDIQINEPGSLIQAGRLSDAEYHLSQIKKSDVTKIIEMEMLARAFADQGDIERALGWCDRILALDPLSSGAYHLRAVIQQDQGDLPSAIQSLRQALYANPDYIPAHLMLGMIMGSQKRQSDAKRHYQVAIRILSTMADDAPVEATDGMPAARVREMVTVLLGGVQVP